MADKMSESLISRILGKRGSRPEEGKPKGPNWDEKPQKPPEKGQSMGNPSDPLGLKKSMADREKAAGLKKGGMVRGCGLARKGHGRGTMR